MIAIRASEARDERFVIASWLSSWRDSYSAGLIQDADWFTVMWPQLEKLLARPGVRCLVAADTDEPEHVADLFGFVAADTSRPTPLLLYVYVKQAYRRAGLARRLLEAVGVDPGGRFEYACKQPLPAALFAKVPYARWNPLAARYPKRER